MRANARWDNPDKTVVRFDLYHGWTWSDLNAAVDFVDELSTTAQRRIDAIFDVSGVEPDDPAALFRKTAVESGKALARRAASLPWRAAVVGANRMINSMFERYHLAYSTTPSNIDFVPTLDEGRRALAASRLREIVYAATAPG